MTRLARHKRLVSPRWAKVCGLVVGAALAMALSCAPAAREAAWDLSQVSLPQLQRDVDRNVSKLKTLKGRARISYESPVAGYAGYTQVAVRMPDSAFIKVEAIFGLDVASLFVDGRSFTAYVPSERRVYRGSIDRLRYLDPLVMAVDSRLLISALSGLISLPREGAGVKGMDSHGLLVERHAEQGLFRYWVDRQRAVVSQVEYEDSQLGLLYRVSFSRFAKTSGMLLPQMVTLERPQQRERVTLFYLERTVNVPPRALQMRQPLPSNVEEVLL